MLKRIFALFICLILISTTSFTAFSEGYIDSNGKVEDTLIDEIAATVYVSANGSDNGKGTADSPFLTLNRAIEMVYHNGTVVIDGELTLASNYSWKKHGKTVTITGGTLNASALSRVVLHDSVIFDNITLTFADKAKLFANGYKLTMGENVTMTQTTYNDNAVALWVYGGGQENTTVKSTNVTILGGVYSRVYGGSYGGTVLGDTNLTVGGNANPNLDNTSHSILCNFYGGGQNDTIGGDANFTYGGNAKASYIYGGSENASALTNNGKSATIGGKVNFNVIGGKAYSIYGGSNLVDHKSDVNLTVTGGEFSQIFGGTDKQALTGNVVAKILGGTIKRRIYGGCYNEVEVGIFSNTWLTSYHVTGTIDLIIGGGANITFSDTGDSDRSIYAHSRHKTNSSSEITSLIFADKAGYDAYKDKLKARDSVMSSVMSGLSAADNLHYYTYTANDTTDVISITCSYDSNESETATLTLDNSVSRVYNGKEIKAAKVVYSSGWKGEKAEIAYSNNVNAGTASAKLTLSGVNVTLNYTIEKAEQSAPKPLLFSTTAETVKGKADGQILGLTSGMDISSDNISFAPVTDANATFASGTYYIRYSEMDNYKPSTAVAVIVEEGKMLTVTFMVDGAEYTIREVEWNATLTNIPEVPHKEGYDQIAPTWDVTDFSEIQSDMEVNAVYTLNGFVVDFVGRDGKVFYTAYVQKDCGVVSEQDLKNAREAAPILYGYDFFAWDKGADDITEDTEITALYSRQTTKYNTTLIDSNGETIDSKQVEFDQRFTIVDDSAKSFLVDGQVVGGPGRISLYGCGELTIQTSDTVEANEATVSILRTVTDEIINGKHVYRVFVHLYNPNNVEVSKLGVMFAPGSAYESDENFKIETLDSEKYITRDTDVPANDLLTTFKGIKNGVTRVVRAYATVGQTNIYSGRVDSHTFN